MCLMTYWFSHLARHYGHKEEHAVSLNLTTLVGKIQLMGSRY